MDVEDREQGARGGRGTILGLLVLILALAAGVWLLLHHRAQPAQAPVQATAGRPAASS